MRAFPSDLQHAVDPVAPNNSGVPVAMIFRLEDPDTGRILKEHRLLFMPQHYQRVTATRTRVRYTQGGVFSDTPARSGIGLTTFTMQGTTGFRPLRDADGKVIVDGAAELKDLEDTFKAAQGADIKTPVVSGVANPRRVFTFTNLDEPVSAEDPSVPEWRIHLDRSLLTITKRAPRGLVWDYSMVFVGEPHDEVPVERTSLVKQVRPSAASIARALRDFPSKVLNEFQSLKEKYVNPLLSIITDVEQAVQNFADGVDSVIDTTFETLNRGLSLIRSIEDNVVRLAQTPHEVMAKLRALRRTFHACFQFGDAFGNPDQVHADGQSFVSGVETSSTQALATPTRSRRVGQPLEVDVVAGDTLSSLSQAHGVSPSAIIEAGKLRYPYVDSTRTRPPSDPYAGGRRVVYRDERVVVPNTRVDYSKVDVLQQVSPGPGDLHATATLEDRLFGVDFYLSDDGRMEWDSTAGDAKLVAGLDNLKQSVERIDLGLDIGSLAHNPRKGSYLRRNLGNFVDSADVRSMARDVERTLRSNPRIASIRSARVDMHGGSATVSFTAVAINGREFPSKARV